MVKINGKDVEWEDAPKGHYLTDVKEKVLWKDERTGAMLAIRKIPKGGIHENPHKHPQANHWVFGLSGEMKYPDGTLLSISEDDYFFLYAPKGDVHGGGPKGTRFTTDCIVLMYFDGPQTKVSE
jgi:2,4'-dihydroxyacetophenone dioxygenase